MSIEIDDKLKSDSSDSEEDNLINEIGLETDELNLNDLVFSNLMNVV